MTFKVTTMKSLMKASDFLLCLLIDRNKNFTHAQGCHQMLPSIFKETSIVVTNKEIDPYKSGEFFLKLLYDLIFIKG